MIPKLATGGWDDVLFPISSFHFSFSEAIEVSTTIEKLNLSSLRWLQRLYSVGTDEEGSEGGTNRIRCWRP